MPPILGYSASVEAAKLALEAAQNALSRDVGQAMAQADWPFLRDRHDVQAMVELIGTLVAQDPSFVSNLHDAGDRVRLAQPLRGRPPKATQGSVVRENADAANGGDSI
jgi:hypothetical protein